MKCRKANSPLVDKIMELLCYWNLMDWLRPFIRKAISLVLGDCLRDLEQIDQMAGPRIIKSHLPLYLLNPEVLSTSKVRILTPRSQTAAALSLLYNNLLLFYYSREKIVYVARNPKDVIVSYYHYHRLLEFHHYTGNLEAFAEYFMTDRGTITAGLGWSPDRNDPNLIRIYLACAIRSILERIVYSAPFFPHLLDAWNKRHHPNLHFVFYEDLKRVKKNIQIKLSILFIPSLQSQFLFRLQNLRGEIEKISQFLGKKLSDDQLSKLTEHLRFDNFAKNETVNCEIGKEIGLMNNSGHFIRKGKFVFPGSLADEDSSKINNRLV